MLLTLEELRRGRCKWPVGEFEHAVFLYCGEPVFQAKPYCLCHCALAYESLATRRRRAAEWAALHPKQASGERSRRWNAYVSEDRQKAIQQVQADAA
jgi:GcrA cell cycle regulator